MLIVPWLLGTVWAVGLTADRDTYALLGLVLAGWLIGYFAYFAATQWLKSRFKRRYLPAVLTYSVLGGVVALMILIWKPTVIWWACYFGPLVAIGLWEAWRRRERSLLSNFVMIAAACAFPLLISTLVGGSIWPGEAPYPWLAAMACFGYFFGTVLFVKTMIRERNQPRFLALSLFWHVVACAWGWAASPALGLFFSVDLIRAVLFPALGPLRRRTIKPVVIGVTEIWISGFFAVAALWPLLMA